MSDNTADFASRIAREKARVYCLQYNRKAPDSCYFFLKIDPLRETMFQKALGGNALLSQQKIGEFGEVVASGWGEPPVRVREVLSENYAITFMDET